MRTSGRSARFERTVSASALTSGRWCGSKPLVICDVTHDVARGAEVWARGRVPSTHPLEVQLRIHCGCMAGTHRTHDTGAGLTVPFW
jgi:hypothetical protein